MYLKFVNRVATKYVVCGLLFVLGIVCLNAQMTRKPAPRASIVGTWRCVDNGSPWVIRFSDSTYDETPRIQGMSQGSYKILYRSCDSSYYRTDANDVLFLELIGSEFSFCYEVTGLTAKRLVIIHTSSNHHFIFRKIPTKNESKKGATGK